MKNGLKFFEFFHTATQRHSDTATLFNIRCTFICYCISIKCVNIFAVKLEGSLRTVQLCVSRLGLLLSSHLAYCLGTLPPCPRMILARLLTHN